MSLETERQPLVYVIWGICALKIEVPQILDFLPWFFTCTYLIQLSVVYWTLIFLQNLIPGSWSLLPYFSEVLTYSPSSHLLINSDFYRPDNYLFSSNIPVDGWPLLRKIFHGNNHGKVNMKCLWITFGQIRFSLKQPRTLTLQTPDSTETEVHTDLIPERICQSRFWNKTSTEEVQTVSTGDHKGVRKEESSR